MLSNVHERKMQVKAQFDAWLDGTETTTGSGMTMYTSITPELIADSIQPIYDTNGNVSQSGPSYQPNLTPEFALAAGVLDPEF